MKQISQISTAKELNKVLLDTLVDLKNGEMDAQIARCCCISRQGKQKQHQYPSV